MHRQQSAPMTSSSVNFERMKVWAIAPAMLVCSRTRLDSAPNKRVVRVGQHPVAGVEPAGHFHAVAQRAAQAYVTNLRH